MKNIFFNCKFEFFIQIMTSFVSYFYFLKIWFSGGCRHRKSPEIDHLIFIIIKSAIKFSEKYPKRVNFQKKKHFFCVIFFLLKILVWWILTGKFRIRNMITSQLADLVVIHQNRNSIYFYFFSLFIFFAFLWLIIFF